MSLHLGVDVGAVGVKAAVLLPAAEAVALSARAPGGGLRLLTDQARGDRAVLVAETRRTRGRPLEVVRELLREIIEAVGAEHVASLALTGSGAALVAKALNVPRGNEFQAAARAVDLLHPEVRTIFEIGGETSKFIRVEPDPGSGALGILDYSTNGDCAAGTGAFLDQQASRLKYAVEDIARIVEQADRAAQIAGRCSVFAKSDMIHSQQKGYTPPEVLRGLCNAVATNFRSAVVKGRTPVPPIILIGGVAANLAVVKAIAETFELPDGGLFVPPGAEAFGAIGAALIGADAAQQNRAAMRAGLAGLTEEKAATQGTFATSPPLSLERVRLLREQTRPYVFPQDGVRVDAYLGLDIGSVGTKLVLIDDDGEVIHSIFTRTEGRPIEVVTRALREMEQAVGSRVLIRGVGSTGSGRELIGELVGADSINDEITCHKTGASFIGDRLLGRRPDTIFEIGGQDSKYISLETEGGHNGSGGSLCEGGRSECGEGHEACHFRRRPRWATAAADPVDSIVVDFTMNEACAAGTGSFLEERAEELGVSIKGEFARLALSSRAPIKLGERCTVFMERDVNTCMQRGARREDVIAGLAYSVGYNYINRVVRGRRIGDCIFFQGGTAYNDAVAAAFAAITGKEIIVPPHNAVLGAIGAALLARDKVQASSSGTRFRGWDVTQIDYGLREFTCKGCGNLCSVQEFTVEGEKTFWGDKCSDRYRKRAKTDRKPVIPDLIALRRELLHADDRGDPPAAKVRIGIPLAMYTHDLLPLYRRFFRDCGFAAISSSETNRRIVESGLEAAVAEPCFPIIVAHGHVADLIARGVDYIWLPNILSAETKFLDNESHVCPWGQTLPFVIRQAPSFRDWKGRLLCPTLRFRHGLDGVREALVRTALDLGASRKTAEQAFAAAAAAQRRFRADYEQAGREALETLRHSGEPGVVIVGRPYNVHDAGLNIAVNRKLREYYGVNLIPIDALPTRDIDIRDVNDNMYWEYGRKILAAAKIVGEMPNLHMIYITNFKCGPDSYIKGFVRPASGKPFLTLQFDGHSNDAGMMTRCEAYLDSKGILRWWRQTSSDEGQPLSSAELSTSPRCPTPAPG